MIKWMQAMYDNMKQNEHICSYQNLKNFSKNVVSEIIRILIEFSQMSPWLASNKKI